MRKIIHDCDCTFGVLGCDVDDGLALIYLLGDQEAQVLGVTTTYGNNKIECVDPTTRKLLQELHREDIPVYKGGAFAGDYESEASAYLAKMAEVYAGELELLVTGSVTNLYGAYLLNEKFFEQVKSITLMGGITEPLLFDKKEMKELNFSCDPLATWTVLTKGKNVSVITGNNCLKVLFTREEYRKRLFDGPKKIASFLKEKTDYWFDDNINEYGIMGFYNWDVVAAVYLMHPELFESEERKMKISQEELKEGKLKFSFEGEENCILKLPIIGDAEDFKNNIYNTWLNVEI